MALGFLKIVSEENRALVLIGSSLGTLGCLAAMLLIGSLRRRLRRWTWRRVLASWSRTSQANSTPKFTLPEAVTEKELIQLAIQAYSRMGYALTDREETEAYLRLVNPDGQIELLGCKQQPDAIALHHIYSLELEMKRTKAVRGFFWAPAGFTREAIDWVLHRPIVLADRLGIERLMDCSQSKGSRLFEG